MIEIPKRKAVGGGPSTTTPWGYTAPCDFFVKLLCASAVKTGGWLNRRNYTGDMHVFIAVMLWGTGSTSVVYYDQCYNLWFLAAGDDARQSLKYYEQKHKTNVPVKHCLSLCTSSLFAPGRSWNSASNILTFSRIPEKPMTTKRGGTWQAEETKFVRKRILDLVYTWLCMRIGQVFREKGKRKEWVQVVPRKTGEDTQCRYFYLK